MLKRAAVVSLVLGLLGCGSGGGGVAAPPVPRRITLFTGHFQMNAGAVLSQDVTPTAAGTITAVLDWSFLSDDLDLLAANVGCNPSTRAGCSVFVEDTRKLSKPAQVSFRAVAGTTYRFLLINNGPDFETGTFNVYLDR